ncbi:MAG: fumarylacetoacetate hydrolase family protein [Lachnospiraceae bacterium]|nr:fumarylacetoacetate hydrolase family protein [Lachnospiraceae bacterium]
MRLYTIRIDGREEVAVENAAGRLVRLSELGVNVSDMNDLIRRYDALKGDIVRGLEQNTAAGVDKTDCKILAPIPEPAQDIICLGVNYGSHMKETVNAIGFTKKAETVYFSKRVNRCNDPDGVIPAYDFVERLDYEVELGVIMGRDALCVNVDHAADYIFGYTIINDVSARDLQAKHQQWLRGKSLDGYAPMGPCIVTADELDAGNLNIQCFVNGEKRQDSNTSYMLTTVSEAVAELSQGMTLRAGTVIATGTPGGVAMGMENPVYLKAGDTVRCVIEHIGELTNTVK